MNVERRIEGFRHGLNRASAAYRAEDVNRAVLLLYDLIGDLQRIRSSMLDEMFSEGRERANALAAPSAPAEPDEAH